MFFMSHVTECFAFRLHYPVTFLVLLGFAGFITYLQTIESPINCIENEYAGRDVVNAYCWSHSTFSVASGYGKRVGVDVPYPGVIGSTNGDDYIFHDYYRYIHVVLLMQAIAFCLPYWLWKYLENDEMEHLWKTLNRSQDHLSMSEKTCLAAESLFNRFGRFNVYALKYLFCEILSVINIIIQTWLLNIIFKGNFLHLGRAAKEYFTAGGFLEDNPLLAVFPRVAKCHLYRFSRGGVAKFDNLCILPINAFTDKIYLFIWFWFVILFVLSSLGILWQIATILSPWMRGIILASKVAPFTSVSQSTRCIVRKICYFCGFGDWFVLNALCKKMDSLEFEQLLTHLNREYETKTDSHKCIYPLIEKTEDTDM